MVICSSALTYVEIVPALRFVREHPFDQSAVHPFTDAESTDL